MIATKNLEAKENGQARLWFRFFNWHLPKHQGSTHTLTCTPCALPMSEHKAHEEQQVKITRIPPSTTSSGCGGEVAENLRESETIRLHQGHAPGCEHRGILEPVRLLLERRVPRRPASCQAEVYSGASLGVISWPQMNREPSIATRVWDVGWIVYFLPRFSERFPAWHTYAGPGI